MRTRSRMLAGLAALIAFLCVGGAVLVSCGNPQQTFGPNPPPIDNHSPPLDPSIFPALGSTDFVTANERELTSHGTQQGYNGRDSLAGEGVADDAPSAAGKNPGPAEPEPDPTREIVEADVFRLDGNVLYLLNSYRGLLAIDMSDPDQPSILGRLPFQAQPLEMYVQDGRAYILMSDFFQYWQWDKEADPLGFHGSQLLIVDVSNPRSMIPLAAQRLDGEVTDSRIVGDVLYTVSHRNPEYWRYSTADWEDRTWIVSLNIADPRAIREVSRVTFQGMSTLIHVAKHAVFVAAHDPNYFLSDPLHPQETLVTYVDISDPAGVIKQRGNIYVPGYIADKFKMDWYEHALRVFTGRGWGAGVGDLYVVDTNQPDAMTVVGHLDLLSTWGGNGSLVATRFDGARAYADTVDWRYNYRRSTLHLFDLSNPAKPARTAGLEIDNYVTHFETRGDRLISLGMDQGSDCSRVQISLFDVKQLAAPRLLSASEPGDGECTRSGATNNYKAFRVIDSLNMILLPIHWWNRYHGNNFTGTQIVDWQNDALTARGAIANFTSVERAFPVGNRIVAVSVQQMQVINALDRDRPQVTGSFYLVHNVLDIWDIGSKQVQLVGDIIKGGYRFEVLDFAYDDDRPILATLALPFTGQPFVFRDGDILHMIGYENGKQVVRSADFSAPLFPKLRGMLVLVDEVSRIYNEGYSFYYYYWSPSAGLPVNNQLIPVTVRTIIETPSGRRDFDNRLRVIDMRDPDNPRLTAASVPMPDWPYVNKVTHGKMAFSSHVEEAVTANGEKQIYHVKSYVDRMDLTDPDNPKLLPKVSVPGWLIDVSDDGRLLYTIDYQWDEFGRRRNSFDVLALNGDVATLMAVLPVGDQVNRSVFRDRTIWMVTQKYPWWGVGRDSVESRQPYTLLNRVTIGSGGGIQTIESAKVEGYHFDLLDVMGSKVFLASEYPYGILVLEASNMSQVQIVNSARTIGFISRLVVEPDYIYLPLGRYGVHRVATTSTAPLPKP